MVYWLSGSGVVIFILLIILLIFRNRIVKHQKIIAEQQVVKLNHEKTLIANQSILEGETAERSRLARDLHDGLGGMLSVVRLNLKGITTGAFVEDEDVTRYRKVLSMLDDSIKELRRVTHHMMPESLLRYGLKASLADFCNDIPSVQFHYYGNESRLDCKLEILIYISAHELVNNALRHAEAKQINLQLVQENDRVSLTVQDDGKGFDPDVAEKGIGLGSVKTRVASFDGKMSIYSSPGHGTEINIEFQLKQIYDTCSDR
jgi:signal transduction histidine kinase